MSGVKVWLEAHRHIGKTAQGDEISFCGFGVRDESLFLQPWNVRLGVQEYFRFAALFDGGIMVDIGNSLD